MGFRKQISSPQRVEVHEEEDGEHRVPEAVDDDELRQLGRLDRRETRRVYERSQHERRQEFERVDVEEDDEEQDRVQNDHRSVPEAEATEELSVQVPDPNECGEGRGKGDEAAQRADELVERVRHLERHDEEREGERERGSAELRRRDL